VSTAKNFHFHILFLTLHTVDSAPSFSHFTYRTSHKIRHGLYNAVSVNIITFSPHVPITIIINFVNDAIYRRIHVLVEETNVSDFRCVHETTKTAFMTKTNELVNELIKHLAKPHNKRYLQTERNLPYMTWKECIC